MNSAIPYLFETRMTLFLGTDLWNTIKAPTGDEHIKNYRGWGGLDMKYIGHETPQTKGT